jgi:hypothetical protein
VKLTVAPGVTASGPCSIPNEPADAGAATSRVTAASEAPARLMSFRRCTHRTLLAPGHADPPACFRLDHQLLHLVAEKRRDENRLGFAVQWGAVRLLGTFLGEDLTAVPPGVVAFVAEQLGVADPTCLI